MNGLVNIVASPIFFGITICILLVLAWRLLTSFVELRAETSMKQMIIRKLTTLGLIAVIIIQGLALIANQRATKGSASSTSPETIEQAVQDQPQETPAATSGDSEEKTTPQKNEAPILRFILWMNLCITLPWITAFATRWILATKSNAASFGLIIGYTFIDLALGMVVPRFAFAGAGGMLRLVFLLVLCAGYNYWACETISKFWVRSKG